MSTDNQIQLPIYVDTPSIKKDSMAGDGPFKATVEIQNNLGFPGEKVENWQKVAIDKMAETLSLIHI